MATISTAKDLRPFLAALETADDPVALLEQQGHTLSPALKTQLKSARKPTPAQLRLWRDAARARLSLWENIRFAVSARHRARC